MGQGIYGSASATLNKTIISMASDGFSTQQIADAVGLKRGAVTSRMSRLMADGKVKRFAERSGSINDPLKRAAILSKRHGRHHGCMSALLSALPLDKAAWLFLSTPDDMTVAEWCGVVLRDVIAEEMGE